ncbi:phage/plasmid primase, P4 family [Streptomyces xanthochromogenes]|uniref:phage/plasmid primase, P4 family n=1 Tax=Streptomyces xanthochromogenes TaxID=67384 RepID=UPI0037FD8E34
MSTEPAKDTLAAAEALHAAGCCVVPVKTDGSKAPDVSSWTGYQKQRTTPEQHKAWFTDGHPGIGVITGAVSGNLEMLELEGRAVDEGVLRELADAFTDNDLGDLWNRLVSGWMERSPSGGLHFHYRVDGAPVPKNTKLANRPAHEHEITDKERELQERFPHKKIVRGLIETRGEGGFVVTAPSHGPVHDTGRPYELLAGGPATLPVITAGEHEALHAVCRMLDTVPADDPAPAPQGFLQPLPAADGDGGVKPGDDYEARTSWSDILIPHGWTLLRTSGQTSYWRRPGKTDPGPSATTGRKAERDRLYVFTTSTEFEAEKPYTKFGAYTLLEHGGDHSAAARELARQGYGSRPAAFTRPALRVVNGFTQPLGPVPPTDGANALRMDSEPRAEISSDTWPESFTDDGNALLFVDIYGEHLRYVPQRGLWLLWDEHRWAWDEGGLVVELARDMIRDLDPYVYAGDEDQEKAARKHKTSSLSRDRVNATVNLARTDRRVVASASLLDASPRDLNTPGGIVDLITGELTPPDPAELHTRSTVVAPDAAMPAPRWEAFLADTFGNDADMIGFVQRLAGYSASADTGIHVLPFLHGGGQNGKSVLMDVLRQLLGDYAATAPAGFLMAGKQEHSEEMARLQGLRLVVASEVNQSAKFDEAKMKELTGGDTITARYMRQSFFSFEPTHHLWLMGNHQPQVKAGGDSFWRRLRLLPFLYKVPDDKKIENLAKILVAEEGPAILAWIVAGAVDVFQGGLRPPAAVMAATQLYAEEEDSLGRFLDECCHIGGGDHVRIETKKLRAAYESWCHAEGEEPLSSSPFGRELKQRGFHKKPSNGKHFYPGLTLVAEDESGDRWGDR